MRLRATSSFSGVLGAHGLGDTFDTDAKSGKLMIDQGYPVKEVQDEGKRAAGKRGAESPAPCA